MAITVNVGKESKTWDKTIMVNPDNLVINPENRGRHFPPTKEEVADLALTILKDTQLTPVEGRKMHDKRVELTYGFTRAEAVKLIREGFTDRDGNFHQDKNFLLKIMVVDINKEEAFMHNIRENVNRKATSPIDDAHNQRKLAENYGKTDAEIARIYGYEDQQKVARYRKLLALNEDAKRLVHEGKMAVSAALDLIALPEEKWAEVIASCSRPDGRVEGSKIKNILRDYQLNDIENDDEDEFLKEPTVGIVAVPEVVSGQTDAVPEVISGQTDGQKPAKNPRKKKAESAAGGDQGDGKGDGGDGKGNPKTYIPRTMKQLKAWLAEERTDEGQKAFLKTLAGWLAGKRTDTMLKNALEKFTDYVRS